VITHALEWPSLTVQWLEVRLLQSPMLATLQVLESNVKTNRWL
jgi:hypothetical protein